MTEHTLGIFQSRDAQFLHIFSNEKHSSNLDPSGYLFYSLVTVYLIASRVRENHKEI